MDTQQPVKVTVYKWAGKWGPFEVKIPCGECTLTLDVLQDVGQALALGRGRIVRVLDLVKPTGHR